MRTERLYKASKRRRQVFFKKLAIVFSVIVIAAGLGITMGSNLTGSNQVSAHDKDIVEKEKYYKSIEIVSGDTLWNLAETHMDDSYDCVQDYIDEVKDMNGLLDDSIHDGQYLMIPYYE